MVAIDRFALNMYILYQSMDIKDSGYTYLNTGIYLHNFQLVNIGKKKNFPRVRFCRTFGNFLGKNRLLQDRSQHTSFSYTLKLQLQTVHK